MSAYTKYNFVLFLPPIDYYKVIFYDVHNCLNVRIVDVAVRGVTNKRELVVNINPYHLPYNPHAFRKPLDSLQIEHYFDDEFP